MAESTNLRTDVDTHELWSVLRRFAGRVMASNDPAKHQDAAHKMQGELERLQPRCAPQKNALK